MTLNEVVCNWDETAVLPSIRTAAAPFLDIRQLEKLSDPACAWRKFANDVRDWLCQATTHCCVVCGTQVIREGRCHAFPQAGLKRIRDFNTQPDDEGYVVGHPFFGLLNARVSGIGGTGSAEKFSCGERTTRNVDSMVDPTVHKALRCRIKDAFVAPLLCSDHEKQFGDWERMCYSGTSREWWSILPVRALFCLAYRAALRQLYLQHNLVRILGERADYNLTAHWKKTKACLEDAHRTFIQGMNDRMPSIDGLQPGHAVWTGVSDKLLPFAGSGIITYPRSERRGEESYVGLVLPIQLRVGSRTLVLLWQTRGTSSDLALDLVQTWRSSKRRGRDQLLGLFFGSADQMFMSPQWWRSVPKRILSDVTDHLHNSGALPIDEKAITLDDTVAEISALSYFKGLKFYREAYADIRTCR